MLRVLQIVDSMNRGGLETFIMNIYRNIDRNKIQFDFLIHTDKKCDYHDEIIELGGIIHSIPARNKGIMKNKKAVKKFFKEHKNYKVVHQHVSSLSYIEPLKEARKRRIPLRIIHSHSTGLRGKIWHKYFHKWNQLKINYIATNYLACSDTAAEWLYDGAKIEKDEYKIVNNGINAKQFAYDVTIRKKLRTELNLDGKMVLGHVGRFAYPKNHDYLIEIFKTVQEMKTNSVLMLVGEGSLKSEIEKKVISYGLADKILFLGGRTDVSDLMQAMDVFVFPSHYEGLPLTLVEAQAAGLPCLISKNITKQIKLTKLITNLSIENSTSIWSKKIIEMNKIKRIDQSRKVIDSGYDAKEVAIKLTELYVRGK